MVRSIIKVKEFPRMEENWSEDEAEVKEGKHLAKEVVHLRYSVMMCLMISWASQ